MQRADGASVALAIVFDDSMTMTAKDGGTSRFERARRGARELLASTREGDAVAIVLAGAPARVGLAATSDLGAARAFVDALSESHRGTDLDGALVMARSLVESLPQRDRRVVLLSDLLDGAPSDVPLGQGFELPLWAPLSEIARPNDDCGVLSADRQGQQVRVVLQCAEGLSASQRELTLQEGEKTVASLKPPSGPRVDVSFTLPSNDIGELVAKLAPGDSIVADDSAPVLHADGPNAVAVVGDALGDGVHVTGGSLAEQGFSALGRHMVVRPIPDVPDRPDDLSPFAALVVDDPPGFTPEQRRVLLGFLERGGVVLLTLGPHAASAPLGATLEPILGQSVKWMQSASKGAKAGTLIVSDSAVAFGSLGASNRVVLSPEDRGRFDVVIPWEDDVPMVGRRAVGLGEAWIATLPLSVEHSDFALRPGFLLLLDAWQEAVQERSAPRRTEVGSPWVFEKVEGVSIEGPRGPLPVASNVSPGRVAPALVGAYRVTNRGRTETRVVAPSSREIAARPRRVVSSRSDDFGGERTGSVDGSPWVAMALLGAMTLELALRARARLRQPTAQT